MSLLPRVETLRLKDKLSICIVLLFFSTNIYGGKLDPLIHLPYLNNKGSFPLKTWKDLRDLEIEKQDEDYSCGSASVATILRSFYGKEVYEKDILDEVIRVGNDGTSSFSDLEKAVKKFGFKAIGLTLSFEKLKSIKIPVIAYLRYRDNDHFTVIRGINEKGLVLLGDPSWGNRKYPEFRFKSMWETRNDESLKGKILILIPKDKAKASLKHNFFQVPSENYIPIELLKMRM